MWWWRGGGGGNKEEIEATPSPAITTDNAAKIGVEVLEATHDAVQLGFNTDGMFMRFGFQYPESLTPALLSGNVPVTSGTQQFNCLSGGSYTLEVNDADGNG